MAEHPHPSTTTDMQVVLVLEDLSGLQQEIYVALVPFKPMVEIVSDHIPRTTQTEVGLEVVVELPSIVA